MDYLRFLLETVCACRSLAFDEEVEFEPIVFGSIMEFQLINGLILYLINQIVKNITTEANKNASNRSNIPP
jgi:hypothetical protein